MKKAAIPALILVFLFLFAALAAAPPADVSGAWELAIKSPRGTNTVKATFKQDGEKLEGVLRSQLGEVSCRGTVKGKEIKLSYTRKIQDNELLVTLTGEIDGDSMKGKADFGGFAEGEWTGKRVSEAAAEKAPAGGSSAEKVDVSGTWDFQVETSAGSGSPTFTFKQDGEKLTGHYKGLFGEADLTGTVKGAEIKFSFKVSVGGQEGTITYTGTIEKNTMKGTAQLGELGAATWTAKKQ